MRSIMASPYQYTVHELNQIVRGHNYFYTDFLMTTKYQIKEGLKQAVEYFEMNVEHLVKYLSTINDNYKEYFGVINDGKSIECWTTQEAYFKSYYEIFDTIYTIWGCHSRLQSFFKDNSDLIKSTIEV